MRASVLGMVLAGGEGTRLYPLTAQRAKPSVPFGGKYRIIDFVLSNFVNSGICSIFVLTQFKSQSLTEHIINGWNISSNLGKGRFIIPVPAQMQTQDRHWYSGTADAIFQNGHLIEDFGPDIVAIFGGDHIYRMDISQMVDFHLKKKALASVATIPVPLEDASGIRRYRNRCRLADRRLPGKTRKARADAPGQNQSPGVDGQLRFHQFRTDETCSRTTIKPRKAVTTSARIFCRNWWSPSGCSPTISR